MEVRFCPSCGSIVKTSRPGTGHTANIPFQRILTSVKAIPTEATPKPPQAPSPTKAPVTARIDSSYWIA